MNTLVRRINEEENQSTIISRLTLYFKDISQGKDIIEEKYNIELLTRELITNHENIDTINIDSCIEMIVMLSRALSSQGYLHVIKLFGNKQYIFEKIIFMLSKRIDEEKEKEEEYLITQNGIILQLLFTCLFFSSSSSSNIYPVSRGFEIADIIERLRNLLMPMKDSVSWGFNILVRVIQIQHDDFSSTWTQHIPGVIELFHSLGTHAVRQLRENIKSLLMRISLSNVDLSDTKVIILITLLRECSISEEELFNTVITSFRELTSLENYYIAERQRAIDVAARINSISLCIRFSSFFTLVVVEDPAWSVRVQCLKSIQDMIDPLMCLQQPNTFLQDIFIISSRLVSRDGNSKVRIRALELCANLYSIKSEEFEIPFITLLLQKIRDKSHIVRLQAFNLLNTLNGISSKINWGSTRWFFTFGLGGAEIQYPKGRKEVIDITEGILVAYLLAGDGQNVSEKLKVLRVLDNRQLFQRVLISHVDELIEAEMMHM